MCGLGWQTVRVRMTESCRDGDIGYFDRAPEKLVLEGYRRWVAGFQTGSVAPWEYAWALYCETLGAEEGRRAMAELGHFVRTLTTCAACPLRSFPFGSQHVCRDECLMLGLIAGMQHEDRDAIGLCVGALSCPARRSVVSSAAEGFASTLREMEQVLLPIPKFAIQDVLSRSSRATIH